MLDWSYRWKIRIDIYLVLRRLKFRYYVFRLKVLEEGCRGLCRIALVLDSQGLRKVERSVSYWLFVRYVEGSTGKEPTELSSLVHRAANTLFVKSLLTACVAYDVDAARMLWPLYFEI